MSLLPAELDSVQNHGITLPRVPALKYPPNTALHAITEFLQSPYLLIGMTVLQLLWLVAILWTGTSSNIQLIVVLTVFSLGAGLVVIFLPSVVLLKIRTFKVWLLQSQLRLILVLGLFVILGAIMYANNQRVWGDEERSLRVANIISANGLERAYQESGWLSKKHPPLMPLLYSLVLELTGPNLFHLRLVSVAFLAAALITTYYLGRELYDGDTGYLSPLLFLSFPLVIRLGTS